MFDPCALDLSLFGIGRQSDWIPTRVALGQPCSFLQSIVDER